MTLASLEVDSEAVTAAITANAVEGCKAWTRWPRLSLHEEASITWTMSDIPFPLFNSILVAELRPEDVTSRIDEAIARSRKADVPIAWWIAPGSSPDNLGDILEERGFVHGGQTTGMAVSLDQIIEGTAPPAGFTVQEVRNDDELEVWGRVMTPIYGFPIETREPWIEMYATVGYGTDSGWRHFIGWFGGRPVAASSVFLGAGVAGVCNVATVPTIRRRGIGTALTLAPLREAQKLGYRIGTLFSSEMGIGIYLKLGFREYCKGNVYLWSNES